MVHISMPSYKLPFWLVFKETTILLLFLINRLLLLGYVFFVCHNKAVKLVSFLRNAPFRRKGTKKNPNVQIFLCFEHKKRALALGVLRFCKTYFVMRWRFVVRSCLLRV